MTFDAVFVDRDGTLIRDPGYLSDPRDVELLPGAAEGIRLLNGMGIPVIVVTNQSGIGRGLFPERRFLEVQAELERQLAARGARLDGTYFCPHDPERGPCDCRKPGAGLFRRAARAHGLRLHRCLYLGDRPRDLLAGTRIAAPAVLVVPEGEGYDEGVPAGAARAPDLLTAIQFAIHVEAAVSRPFQVAVLVSGSGTNLQALLDRFGGGADAPVRVSRVLASRAGIGAIERARTSGVEWAVLPAGVSEDELAEAMLRELEAARADLAVLAGFLRLVPPAVVRAYRGRILNIHPALLPAFGGPGMYGRRVHEAVLASGARISGPTVHVVDEEYDHGAIVAQWPVPVLEGDDADRLAARVLEVEHRLLPDVVGALAAGDLVVDSKGRPEWRRPLFETGRFGLTSETA